MKFKTHYIGSNCLELIVETDTTTVKEDLTIFDPKQNKFVIPSNLLEDLENILSDLREFNER